MIRLNKSFFQNDDFHENFIRIFVMNAKYTVPHYTNYSLIPSDGWCGELSENSVQNSLFTARSHFSTVQWRPLTGKLGSFMKI